MGIAVRDTRRLVKRYLGYAYVPYAVARWYQTYELRSLFATYPMWMHPNDVPTMQAAHAKDPNLEAYLRAKAKTWSSNYIASDLRVDVWAARVCLDLYGIETPKLAKKPEECPRAEVNFQYNALCVVQLFNQGLQTGDVAIELGVTEQFLRAYWKMAGIQPVFGLAGDAYKERVLARIDNHDAQSRQNDWIESLRGYNVQSVSEAAAHWGISYQGARKRLQVLGWNLGESVSVALGIK